MNFKALVLLLIGLAAMISGMVFNDINYGTMSIVCFVGVLIITEIDEHEKSNSKN